MIHPHDESPFPLRLKQARLMLGLSLRELCVKIGNAVSHVALAKYELGEMKPTGEVLAKLCEALGRSPDFMFRPVRVSLDKVSFRKRKKFGQKDTEALLERVRHHLEDYLEAEELTGEQGKTSPKLNFPQKFNPTDLEPIRDLARQLRRAWGLGDEPIVSLVELLESHGFRVIEIPVNYQGFDGCHVEGLNTIVVGTWAGLSVARKRHTIAHELAHAVLNAWISGLGLSEADEEAVMGTFASEFLLPVAALKRYLGQAPRTSITLQELLEVKLRYGASISAMVYTMKKFGMISESAYKRFYSHIVPLWKKQFNGEPGDPELAQSLREQPNRFQRLVLRGVTEGTISLSRGGGLLGKSVGDMRREAVPIVE